MKKPNRIPNTTCDNCGKEIYRRPSTLIANKGKYCSRSCRNKVYRFQNTPPILYGDKNPAWKGGVTQFKKKGNYKGLVYKRAPEHLKQMARKDGYIMEHRLVMAEKIGRILTRSECVHHIDHNPSNNSLSNLELWPTNADHKRGEVGRYLPGVCNKIYFDDQIDQIIF